MTILKFSYALRLFALVSALSLTTTTRAQNTQPKNVVLFIAGGGGLTTWNAGSIYKYGKPQALFTQSLPNVGLADTATATEWVTDGAAASSGIATGVKPSKGVLAQSAAAIRGVQNGEDLESTLEYAQEHSLSTGVITNANPNGLLYAVNAAFYAHSNDRSNYADIFKQILKPRFGNGVDVLIGAGREKLYRDASAAGITAKDALQSAGYGVFESMDSWHASGLKDDRVAVLLDDPEFDLRNAVSQATQILSRNPKGFMLVVYSDCHHFMAPLSVVNRVIGIDNAVQEVAKTFPTNTLILVTADNAQKFVVQGENLSENSRKTTGKDLFKMVSMEDQHTAEEVPVMASGPGSSQVHGFFPNTHLFDIVMSAKGWTPKNNPSPRPGGRP